MPIPGYRNPPFLPCLLDYMRLCRIADLVAANFVACRYEQSRMSNRHTYRMSFAPRWILHPDFHTYTVPIGLGSSETQRIVESE